LLCVWAKLENHQWIGKLCIWSYNTYVVQHTIESESICAVPQL
jgi:hypothetical protein